MVIERVATLREIETHWSIDDVADAHEALDIRQKMEAEAMAKVKAPRPPRR